MKPILETPRLLIREFVPEDLDGFFRLVSDPDVTRFTGDRAATREAVQQGMEERVFGAYRKQGYGRWATILKSEDRLIGFAGLKYLDDVCEIDLGYRFFKEYWGQGLATEACGPIVKYGFETLGLRRIIGIVDRANAASIRVLEKLAFQFEGFRTYLGIEVAWYGLEAPGKAGRA